MKNSLVDRILFPGTAWALLLLVPITFLGFYPSYFGRLNIPTPTVVHVHSIFMMLWLAMAIVQPILLKYHKLTYHRLVGKISYGIMPMVIASGYFILRHSYQRALSGEEVGPPGYYAADLPLHSKAAEFVTIGCVYWLWLMVYYVLGISFRKNLAAHATFMLAAALTILGPAGDRLVGHLCDAMDWPFNAIAGNFVFGLVFVVFASLFALHVKRKLILWPTLLVLVLHLTGIFFYYNMAYHPLWERCASLLFYGYL
ncbi:MAG: hypothetical protein KF845_05370 [Cyclobacteriaceae bacterium]|nr:hypothetical protein [Cyclobacteriaceae bacterium]